MLRSALACLCLAVSPLFAAPTVLNVWPAKAPGETKELPAEADQTKDNERPVAGRRVIRLGNVSTPQLAIYRPAKDKDTGAAVVICPGGGFNILAYDLEGTEVAEWLNSIGVTGIVLKYRVPARDPQKRHLAALQDTQRALSLIRSKAGEWGIDPKRIGVLGFSAGGAAAGMAALEFAERSYPALDAVDQVSCRPDFAFLIYAAYFVERGQSELRPGVKVPKDAPPTFFVHAFDDGIPVQNALLLAAEFKKANVPVEVHTYDIGGHGYGLRYVAEQPVTTWPARASEWMARRGLLKKN